MIQNDVLGNARLEGMEDGRAEEKNNIARKMLDNGLSIEQIALIIGLTEKEIKNYNIIRCILLAQHIGQARIHLFSFYLSHPQAFFQNSLLLSEEKRIFAPD